jgi:hypothetical protein
MTSRQAVTEDGQTFSIPLGLTITSNATILDKRDSRDRYNYFRDRERNVKSRGSSPRPLSDFNVIEVDGKLSISHGCADSCGDYF